jgi:predicted nucleic acid-binding protein
MSCVLDTNVLIYFLDDRTDQDIATKVESAIRAGAHCSLITRMEVLGWREHTDESRRSAQALLDRMNEIAITSLIADRVIQLRSQLSIKIPDAIIAASALALGLPLMTRNTEDFRRVPGLQLIDPFAS